MTMKCYSLTSFWYFFSYIRRTHVIRVRFEYSKKYIHKILERCYVLQAIQEIRGGSRISGREWGVRLTVK